MASSISSNYINIIRHIGEQSSILFVVSTVVSPLLVVITAFVIDDLTILLYLHILSGTIWFGMAIIVPAILSLCFGTVSPSTAKSFTKIAIPKIVVFMLGISLTTVLSGSFLAEQFGLLRADNPWMMRVVVFGWLLWLFGLFVSNRMHLRVYFEGQSSTPNPARLKSIEKRVLLLGAFEAAIMVGIIFTVINPGFRLSQFL
ncbi:hypothetical protein [Haladaptatus sp. NG-SE-30]